MSLNGTAIETAWGYMLNSYDRHTIVVWFTFFIHEIIYFGRYIPFYICDHVPALRKYKIQQDKSVSAEMYWRCLKGLAFSHIVVQLPMMLAFHSVVEKIGMKMALPLPPLWKIAFQCIIFLIIEDCWEYWSHRIFHWGPLYKYIHKQHHEFQAPFGLVGEYAHPVETLVLGIGSGLGPALFASDLHLLTLWVFLMLRLFQVVDAHSGYDFPWSLHHFLPFWAGADFHDHHHLIFLGNYSSSFRWNDWIFGTDVRYNAYKEQLRAKKLN